MRAVFVPESTPASVSGAPSCRRTHASPEGERLTTMAVRCPRPYVRAWCSRSCHSVSRRRCDRVDATRISRAARPKLARGAARMTGRQGGRCFQITRAPIPSPRPTLDGRAPVPPHDFRPSFDMAFWTGAVAPFGGRPDAIAFLDVTRSAGRGAHLTFHIGCGGISARERDTPTPGSRRSMSAPFGAPQVSCAWGASVTVWSRTRLECSGLYARAGACVRVVNHEVVWVPAAAGATPPAMPSTRDVLVRQASYPRSSNVGRPAHGTNRRAGNAPSHVVRPAASDR